MCEITDEVAVTRTSVVWCRKIPKEECNFICLTSLRGGWVSFWARILTGFLHQDWIGTKEGVNTTWKYNMKKQILLEGLYFLKKKLELKKL